MSPGTRLAAFAAAVALLSGGAAAAGGAIDPKGKPEEPTAHSGGHGTPTDTRSADDPHGASHGAGAGDAAAQPVRGLAVAADGLRLEADAELRRGRTEQLNFRVVDDRGRTVRDFDLEHEKRMHLIIARRDLTGFQHLHPRQRADGSWATRVQIEEAGSYRLFADFSRGGEAYTLASDVRVDGSADLRGLPAPQRNAVSDGGYDVRLDSGRVRPGEEAELRFTVTEDGAPVHTEPYLGAGGHLVALREGDLAFLHVHPAADAHAGRESQAVHDDSVGFAATFPTQGRYRLFLQFKRDGAVQTVAFTQEVR